MNLKLFTKNNISLKSKFQMSLAQKMTKNQSNISDLKLKHLNQWSHKYPIPITKVQMIFHHQIMLS